MYVNKALFRTNGTVPQMTYTRHKAIDVVEHPRAHNSETNLATQWMCHVKNMCTKFHCRLSKTHEICLHCCDTDPPTVH